MWRVHYGHELEVARAIAREAGDEALRYQVKGVTAEQKSDLSPVTVADRECEKIIVKRLHEAFPDDGLLGEEGAFYESRSGRRWIIDPVDGTRDFVRGTPRWCVLLGLEIERDNIPVGIAHFPVLDETYFATTGGGAYCNDSALKVSNVTLLSKAVVCVNGLIQMKKAPYADRLIPWLSHCFAARSFGGGPDAMALVRGEVDVWLEPGCQPWDLAPLKVIFAEAGARMFDYEGRNTIYSNHAVACVPGLEDEVWKLIGGNPGARCSSTNTTPSA